MPTYSYFCNKCNKNVELVQKMSERQAPLCEECDTLMESQIALSNFQLKGDGWAKDGYSSRKK